jgi:hypothetical protein
MLKAGDEGEAMRRKTLLVILVSVCCLAGVGAAQVSNVPYLYYYSNLLNAFVVERADGTDSHLLAESAMPRDHNRVEGPGWSPSGEWFAWMSARDRSPGNTWFMGWIINTNGSERLTFLDGMNYIVQMEWSESEDILFVHQFDFDKLQFYYLIDTDEREVILAAESIEALSNARYQTYLETDDDMLILDDSMAREQFEFNINFIVYVERKVYDDGDHSISPDGRYMGELGQNRTIVDTHTNQAIDYEPYDESNIYGALGVMAYVWHPYSEWVITVEDLTYAGGKGPDGIGVLGMNDGMRRELTSCRYAEVCANWLPDRVIPYLADGDPALDSEAEDLD